MDDVGRACGTGRSGGLDATGGVGLDAAGGVGLDDAGGGGGLDAGGGTSGDAGVSVGRCPGGAAS